MILGRSLNNSVSSDWLSFSALDVIPAFCPLRVNKGRIKGGGGGGSGGGGGDMEGWTVAVVSSTWAGYVKVRESGSDKI